MNDRPPEPTRDCPQSIVELVFAGQPPAGGRRLAVAGLFVLALYTGAFTLVTQLRRSAGAWSAEMAARIHEAIAVERAVDVTPPPPPPSPPVTAKDVPHPEAIRSARTPRAVHATPAAPAQAARLAAAAPAAADFTGMAFVVGSSATYAGGSTMTKGTSRSPVSGAAAPGGTGQGVAQPNRARSVSLAEAAWKNCPWPTEAEVLQVNEQTVVLRATVRVDGRAEQVDVLSDPGFGFGAQARLCALATHFEPARDPAGQPITALSPPIRVHFFR